MQVYDQSLQEFGSERYPWLDQNEQRLEAEQDFYLYLRDFLRPKDSIIAVWEDEGSYVSALRLEAYRDGVLIEGLETLPYHRQKGYAINLLKAVLLYLEGIHCRRVYSHIHKKNIPSIRTHLSCGFDCLLDYSVYIDGSVDNYSYTYMKEIP